MDHPARPLFSHVTWRWTVAILWALLASACGDDDSSSADDGAVDSTTDDDAGIDTPTDAPTDTPTDTPTDAPIDTPTDTPTDTAIDTPTDTPATILWRDEIQTGGEPWGFDGIGVEHPIGTTVVPDDANGANLSRVPDPLSGAGFALRHFATFDTGGSRSQAGIYSFANAAFDAQAKSPEGVWVAQEWYFPEAIGAADDPVPWINLWDWHSTDAGGGNRWHTSPGLMLTEDGSMRVRWEWGGPANAINPTSADSTIALPVGEWFDIEMHYVWTTGTTTLSLWINGALALEQTGVQTRTDSHETVETYMKFYGSTQGGTPWSPTPSVRYTRNVRIAGERIWR
jgi:hypothetical protein